MPAKLIENESYLCDGGGPFRMSMISPEKKKFEWPSFQQVVNGLIFFGIKAILVLVIGLFFHAMMIENEHIPHIDPLIVRICWTVGWGEILGCIGVVGVFFLTHFGRKALRMKGLI